MKLPNRLALVISGALMATSISLKAQNQVYSENFDTDSTANWILNAGLGANMANFYFDYALAGIPSAPNSVGGTTRGMILQPNMDPATQAGTVAGYGLSVSPLGFSITENFEMRFDMWLNYPNNGGNGSTVVGGAGFGTAGSQPQIASPSAGVVDSVFIGTTTDGGSSADYRIYTPNSFTSVPDGNPAYVNVTSRNNTQLYYSTNFPSQAVPQAQTNLFPVQTGLVTPAGVQGMKWHDVLLSKVANIITYSIDGVLIARVDASTNGALGGANILFNCFDINGNASTDPLSTNLLFALFDNVRITNFANVVTVTAPGTPSISEGDPSPGVFTITRTEAGTPATISYTLSGEALNGTDYTNQNGAALSGTVTFAASATETNVYVYAVDDSIPEITERIILSIDPSPNYVGAGNATIAIVDNETPVLTITNISSQMVERTNDFATFRISRLGNTNTGPFDVNVTFSGSATMDADFYTNEPPSFALGQQTTDIRIYPVQDSVHEGNEIATVTISSASGGEYTIGVNNSASVTIVDGNYPAATVLFSDDFNTDSSANWSLKFASTNEFENDYTALFAFDYGAYTIPPAPHGNGDTLGLFLTVNKNDGNPVAAALNLYPNGQNFSGNFALRADMLLSMASSGSSTEYALMGINHSGAKTNWWRSGGVPAGWTFDGIFYAVETDAQSAPNYVNYSSPNTANNPTALTAGANASAFTSAFKSPPWAVAGSPAVNNSSNTPVWVDMELSQIGNIVTLRLNNTTILSYSNETTYTSGNIMLGYEDAFDSIGPIQNFVIYDNVRVVRIDGLTITATADAGANVQIDFTFGLNDSPSGFKVQAASDVAGPYTDASATIIQLSPGVYRATIAKSGDAQFYRIRHN